MPKEDEFKSAKDEINRLHHNRIKTETLLNEIEQWIRAIVEEDDSVESAVYTSRTRDKLVEFIILELDKD